MAVVKAPCLCQIAYGIQLHTVRRLINVYFGSKQKPTLTRGRRSLRDLGLVVSRVYMARLLGKVKFVVRIQTFKNLCEQRSQRDNLPLV